MHRRKIAAVVDVDRIVVEGRSDVHTVRGEIHAVHVRTCIDGANIRPGARVPNTNEVVFGACDDEFTVRRVVHAVVIAVGTGGELVLVVGITDCPGVAEIGSPIAVPVRAPVLVNGRCACSPRTIICAVLYAVAVRISSVSSETHDGDEEKERQPHGATFGTGTCTNGMNHETRSLVRIKGFLPKCSNKPNAISTRSFEQMERLPRAWRETFRR